MKKIFALLTVFAALIFVVSCGGSSKSDKTNDSTDTGETMTDEDSADSGHGDTTPEQPDNEETGRKQGELYGECYPNATCNKGLVCDEENNVCIKDPNGNSNDSDNDVTETDDDSDSTHDDADSDSDSDSSDSTADDADTSDSQSDDNADTDSGDQDEPCTTIDAKLWWSPKTAETMDWLSALNYCEKKVERFEQMRVFRLASAYNR